MPPLDSTSALRTWSKEIQALGGHVIMVDNVRESHLRLAGIERAKAVVVLGDDDVRAIRVALVVEELAPNVRIVIEMTNPDGGGRAAGPGRR